jgi:hypothetical protein
MKRAKYPAECPVFELDGEHIEVRPNCFSTWMLMRVYNGDIPFVFRRDHLLKAKPLTRAARELLAWSRQS